MVGDRPSQLPHLPTARPQGCSTCPRPCWLWCLGRQLKRRYLGRQGYAWPADDDAGHGNLPLLRAQLAASPGSVNSVRQITFGVEDAKAYGVEEATCVTAALPRSSSRQSPGGGAGVAQSRC